jgi:plastocyanin
MAFWNRKDMQGRRGLPGSATGFVVLAALLMILMVGLVAAGCGGSTSGTTTTAAGPATTGGTGTTAGTATTAGAVGAQVVLKNFAFDPASITVKAGDTVTWTNQDSATHTVAADNGEFKSGDLGNGATFSFTFAKAGTYPYHCSIHPNMKGTVVVQ